MFEQYLLVDFTLDLPIQLESPCDPHSRTESFELTLSRCPFIENFPMLSHLINLFKLARRLRLALFVESLPRNKSNRTPARVAAAVSLGSTRAQATSMELVTRPAADGPARLAVNSARLQIKLAISSARTEKHLAAL